MRGWLFFLLACCIAMATQAQDISGQWVGDYYDEGINMAPTQKVIVTLNVTPEGKVSGTTYLQYQRGHEYYMIVGFYNAKTGVLFIKEMIALSIKGIGYTRMGNYTVSMKRKNGYQTFDGIWRDNKPEEFMAIADSRVYFRRPEPKDAALLKSVPAAPTKPTTAPAQKKPATPKPVAKPTPPPATSSQPSPQKKATQSPSKNVVYISTAEQDSIRIDVLDNGESDGDRISLYLDGKLLLQHHTLSEEAHTFYLSLHKNKPLARLKMIAESNGHTPPCTAYLRITTTQKQLGISLSSELNQNGVVELILRP